MHLHAFYLQQDELGCCVSGWNHLTLSKTPTTRPQPAGLGVGTGACMCGIWPNSSLMKDTSYCSTCMIEYLCNCGKNIAACSSYLGTTVRLAVSSHLASTGIYTIVSTGHCRACNPCNLVCTYAHAHVMSIINKPLKLFEHALLKVPKTRNQKQ